MADKVRTATRSLAWYRALEDEPYKFGFFQAVRRLECLHQDKPRMGESPRPEGEPARLSQEPSLAFAPSTLSAFEPAEGTGHARLVQRFFGLFGPNGPLPLHLTEYARERSRNSGDPTLVRFLDVFHHRMLAMFYRAWATAQPTVQFDRPESDRFASYVGALLGLGMKELRDRDAFPDREKLFFAGHLACQTRHPEGLLAIIRGFFHAPVRIDEFVGRWIEIPVPVRSQLGMRSGGSALGVNVTVGSHVWDCQQTFRIVLGPMGYTDYLRFLPKGDRLAQLVAIVRNYVGDELAWEVNLVLKKEETPRMALGRQGHIGWTAWVASRRPEKDADDFQREPLAQPRELSGHD